MHVPLCNRYRSEYITQESFRLRIEVLHNNVPSNQTEWVEIARSEVRVTLQPTFRRLRFVLTYQLVSMSTNFTSLGTTVYNL